MNRYAGNTGQVERIPEEFPRRNMYNYGRPERPDRYEREVYESPVEMEEAPENKKPSGLANILGGLGGLGSKISTTLMSTDDILLAVIMYLLYRESGDIEFLIIGGAMLIL